MKDLIHKRIVERRALIDSWFEEKIHGIDFPIYASVDIRDAGIKLASVDANVFPAGFNNICDLDLQTTGELILNYLTTRYGNAQLKILLLTEEHTSNKYYWENVYTLFSLLTQAGSEVRIAVPKPFKGTSKIITPRGHEVTVYSATRQGDSIKVEDGFVPQLVVSNNDFSNPYTEWVKGLSVPINPPYELGWFRRKKSNHFRYYNNLALEFSRLIEVHPWTFTVDTQVETVDFDDPTSIEALAQKSQLFLDKLSQGYKSEKRACFDPVVYIKNNRGTYGMGIISVKSGEEVLKMSQKERKKMGYSKGGGEVHEVIIQEGIPTQVSKDGDTAEPVIYLVGDKLAGGFLRTHKEKNQIENLNSPGAVFKRLCMSDLMVNVEGSVLENVYGWVARLNALAIGLEGHEVGAKYRFAK